MGEGLFAPPDGSVEATAIVMVILLPSPLRSLLSAEAASKEPQRLERQQPGRNYSNRDTVRVPEEEKNTSFSMCLCFCLLFGTPV